MLFSEESGKHPIVILKDVSFETLKNVIDFVYRGEIQIAEGDLKEFLELAESLQIKGLNDTSMNDACETFICDASRDGIQGPSSGNQKGTFEVQSTSAGLDSTGSSFGQTHYHLCGYPVTAQTNPSLFEKYNRDCEKEKSIFEVALSQEKNEPVLLSHVDREIDVKELPLKPESVVMKIEQIDEYDELMQKDNTDYLDKCGTPKFTEQNLNQYSQYSSAAEPPPDQGRQRMRPAPHSPFPSPTQALEPPQPGERQPQPFGLSPSDSSASFSSRADPKQLTGERPHRCNLCGKAYHQKGSLVVHMRTHTGERPYRCDVCGNAFDSSSTLVVHKRRHTGERPYACDVCGLAFAQRSTLITHKRRHTGERPFCCGWCGKTFIHSTHLYLHLRNHHAEDRSRRKRN